MTVPKIDENGRKFSKRVEDTMGKGEIASYEQFLLFPLFSEDLYCRPGLVWEKVKLLKLGTQLM